MKFRELAISCILAGLTLTGCEQGPVGSGILSAVGITASNCPPKAKVASAFTQLSDAASRIICLDSLNYACSHRVFSPIVTDSDSVNSECVTFDKNSICLGVRTLNFNTSKAISQAAINPKAFEPGGEFNNQEYSCYNTEFRKQLGVLISGESDSLAKALESAKAKCLVGSAK